MYSALYYPNIQIESERLLKSALLLWDRLEFITPSADMGQYSGVREIDEALKMITCPHVPTDEEKKLAHEGVMELATSDLPKEFLLRDADPALRYKIYPTKFLPDTWDALRQTDLAIHHRDDDFYEWAISRSLGLAMMSLLAESCAGTELRTVTNKLSAYKNLAESISGLHGGAISAMRQNVEGLVTISLKIVDASSLSLKRLIQYRRREDGAEGAYIRGLRHQYLEKIDSFIERLKAAGGHVGSREEIERQFKQEMEDDVKNPKEALKLKANEALLSKEVAISVLASAGMSLTPITVPSAIIGVGALLKKAVNYREERKDVLKKHAMSWLFELSKGPVKVY